MDEDSVARFIRKACDAVDCLDERLTVDAMTGIMKKDEGTPVYLTCRRFDEAGEQVEVIRFTITIKEQE
jgi:hypothetical protein